MVNIDRQKAILDEVMGRKVVLTDFESRLNDKLFALNGHKIKGYFELVKEDYQ